VTVSTVTGKHSREELLNNLYYILILLVVIGIFIFSSQSERALLICMQQFYNVNIFVFLQVDDQLSLIMCFDGNLDWSVNELLVAVTNNHCMETVRLWTTQYHMTTWPAFQKNAKMMIWYDHFIDMFFDLVI
jgi:hypothetical protein